MGKRRPAGIKGWMIGLGLVLFFIFLFVLTERNLKPTILAMAETRTKNIATKAINNAIQNIIAQDAEIWDLVVYRQDAQGRIVLLQPNTIKINQLASDTALEVQKTLVNLEREGFNIPLGQTLGSSLLANYGPLVQVKIQPAGTVQVLPHEKFEEAGINQTKHTISLRVVSEMGVVIPLVSSKVKVETEVPIATTIIAGTVPDFYVKMGDIPGKLWDEP